MYPLRLILILLGALLLPLSAGPHAAARIMAPMLPPSRAPLEGRMGAPPQLLVAPTTVAPGATLTVAGTGFVAGESLLLTLGGSAVTTTPPVLVADAQGNFIATAMVPATLVSGVSPLVVLGARSHIRARTLITVQRPVAATWYFAGLDTAAGRRSAIAVLNPDNDPARLTLHLAHTDGPANERTILLAGHRRTTLDLGALTDRRHALLFVRLRADRHVFAAAIVAPVGGTGSSVPGVSRPQRVWYLAAGSITADTHDAVRLYNPASHPVVIAVRLLPQQGPSRLVQVVLGGDRGRALDVSALMRGHAVGAIIVATRPVFVLRVSTFGRHTTGLAVSTGMAHLAATWTFPVGLAPAGGRTVYAVANPNPTSPAAVTATGYDTGGRVMGRVTAVMAPYHQATMTLPLTRRSAAFVVLTSNLPIVAEQTILVARPAAGSAEAAQGFTEGPAVPAVGHVFADGNTGPGYREYLVVQNATSQPARLGMEFYTTRGTAVHHDLSLPPHARAVVLVNQIAGLPAGAHGTVVFSTGTPVFMEQQIVGQDRASGRPFPLRRHPILGGRAPCLFLLPRAAFPTHLTGWVSTVTTPNAGAVVSGLQLVHYRWGYIIVTPNRYAHVADAQRHYAHAAQLLHGDRPVAVPAIGQPSVVWVTGDQLTHYTITTVLLRAQATVTEINVGAGGPVLGVATDLARAARVHACG